MKESYWGVVVFSIGMIAITFTFLFQNITNTDEHNFTILKDVTEAAMYDAFDLASYRYDGTIRIDREKYVENFIRRFADDASLARNYKVEIMDVNELPPKVSIRVTSNQSGSVFSLGKRSLTADFDIVNRLDAILEIPY
jgi:hypothetical protein